MSERTGLELLGDILEATRRIRSYVGEMSYEEFRSDTKTQDSVLRNLEVIGEASRKLPTHERSMIPGVPWKSMAGMRDRLIHDYAGVNLDIVWQVISEELPRLVREIEPRLQEP